MRRACVVIAGLMALGEGGLAAQKPPAKTDIVAVSGCLREQPAGEWRIVNASDPKPSNANAPTQSELAEMAVSGKNQFRLIGVSIFDLPSHRDHTVVVKGLLIQDPALSRLNITSVVTVAPTCTVAK